MNDENAGIGILKMRFTGMNFKLYAKVSGNPIMMVESSTGDEDG